MPYEFAEWEDEPKPQAGSRRGGKPPEKSVGVGVLDPPGPPSKPGLPSVWLPGFTNRVFATLILAGLALVIGALVRFWFLPRP